MPSADAVSPSGVDSYAASAGVFDLMSACVRDGQLAALNQLVPYLQPDYGPILDVGAGSGLNIEFVVETLPSASVCALEPKPVNAGARAGPDRRASSLVRARDGATGGLLFGTTADEDRRRDPVGGDRAF